MKHEYVGLINTRLSLKGCWNMVNRIETLEHCRIAQEWLYVNSVITTEQYDELMRAVSHHMFMLYREQSGRA